MSSFLGVSSSREVTFAHEVASSLEVTSSVERSSSSSLVFTAGGGGHHGQDSPGAVRFTRPALTVRDSTASSVVSDTANGQDRHEVVRIPLPRRPPRSRPLTAALADGALPLPPHPAVQVVRAVRRGPWRHRRGHQLSRHPAAAPRWALHRRADAAQQRPRARRRASRRRRRVHHVLRNHALTAPAGHAVPDGAVAGSARLLAADRQQRQGPRDREVQRQERRLHLSVQERKAGAGLGRLRGGYPRPRNRRRDEDPRFGMSPLGFFFWCLVFCCLLLLLFLFQQTTADPPQRSGAPTYPTRA